MVDFIIHALLCDDKGLVRDADKEWKEEWKVSQSYCDAVVKSGFDGVNHFNEIIVSLETEGRKTALRHQSTLFSTNGRKNALLSLRSTSTVLRMLLVLLAMTPSLVSPPSFVTLISF